MQNINGLQNVCYCVSGLAFRNDECGFDFLREIGVFHKVWSVLCCTGFFFKYFNRELSFDKMILLWIDDLRIE